MKLHWLLFCVRLLESLCKTPMFRERKKKEKKLKFYQLISHGKHEIWMKEKYNKSYFKTYKILNSLFSIWEEKIEKGWEKKLIKFKLIFHFPSFLLFFYFFLLIFFPSFFSNFSWSKRSLKVYCPCSSPISSWFCFP